jgi:hypothetical protein
LPADAPLGQNVREYLKLDDQIYTIKRFAFPMNSVNFANQITTQ